VVEKVISDEIFTQSSPISILVTGATGFIGSRLISSLVKSGYTVTVV